MCVKVCKNGLVIYNKGGNMALHHTEYKQNYKEYILDCLKGEDCFIDKQPTDEELINYLLDRFNSEYGWSIERQGKQKAMADWLSGLAIRIAFYYEDIIELAIEMGSIDANPSDQLTKKVCENYFTFMANMILSFEPKSVEVA